MWYPLSINVASDDDRPEGQGSKQAINLFHLFKWISSSSRFVSRFRLVDLVGSIVFIWLFLPVTHCVLVPLSAQTDISFNWRSPPLCTVHLKLFFTFNWFNLVWFNLIGVLHRCTLYIKLLFPLNWISNHCCSGHCAHKSVAKNFVRCKEHHMGQSQLVEDRWDPAISQSV